MIKNTNASYWLIVVEFSPRNLLTFLFCLDYLLSNNHVNSIIVHKFDFSDEEIMAYYISFLKTLSLKLNNHTVHFFYNEVRPQNSGDVESKKEGINSCWNNFKLQLLTGNSLA